MPAPAAPLTLIIMATTIILTLTLVLSGGNAQQCPKNPPAAIGSGGLVQNPNVDKGIAGWEAVGSARISVGSSSGNNFVVASDRKVSTYSIRQTFKNVQKNRFYRLTAWIR